MPIFVSQGCYSQDALKGMLAKPEDRGEAAAKLVQAAGGKMLAYYVTFGEYDWLVVSEMPDEQHAAAFVLTAAASGGVTNVAHHAGDDHGAGQGRLRRWPGTWAAPTGHPGPPEPAQLARRRVRSGSRASRAAMVRAELGRGRGDGHSGLAQDLDLLRRTLAEGRDDRAGMAHLAALGRAQAGDVGGHRLVHVVARRTRAASASCGPPISPIIRTASVSGSVSNSSRRVLERAAVDRIAADADAGRDADAELLHLRGGLVAQRARAADHADAPAQVDVAGHDAEQAACRG